MNDGSVMFMKDISTFWICNSIHCTIALFTLEEIQILQQNNVTEDVGIILITLFIHLLLEPKVRVSWAQSVAHLAHAPRQVCPESITARLQIIKCSHYYGFMAAIGTKLSSQSGPDFLLTRHGDVGVQNISSPYINIV